MSLRHPRVRVSRSASHVTRNAVCDHAPVTYDKYGGYYYDCARGSTRVVV